MKWTNLVDVLFAGFIIFILASAWVMMFQTPIEPEARFPVEYFWLF